MKPPHSGLNHKSASAQLDPTRQSRDLPRRVLVVEADPGTRKTCQNAVTRCGMVADIVDNGVAAVSSVRQAQPDLIIMDLQLRDSPGLEVIQWLRSTLTLKATPVIVLSTNASDVSRSKSWGVDAVLIKPVTCAIIENAIQDAFALDAS